MKIRVSEPSIGEEELEALKGALFQDKLVLGSYVKKFEEEFAKYVGTTYAVSVSSGTDALIFSLKALKFVKKTKRNYVITTPFTFISTVNAILYAGLEPIFVDINPQTYTIDSSKVQQIIKKYGKDKILAILPVHLYGYPCDLDNLIYEDIFLVEDACQAHGAIYNSKKIGGYGISNAFSFYPTKNMTVGGDGGMVTTNDVEIKEFIEKLRNVGRVGRYEHDILGRTSRLDSIKAAIGIVQLKKLDKMNERRRQIAKIYYDLLRDLEEKGKIVLPPRETNNIKPVYHLFVIRCKERDQLRNFLEKHEIETNINYPIPVHLQPFYKKMYNYKSGMFPHSERAAREVLSIPIHPNLKDEDVAMIAEKIRNFFKNG